MAMFVISSRSWRDRRIERDKADLEPDGGLHEDLCQLQALLWRKLRLKAMGTFDR